MSASRLQSELAVARTVPVLPNPSTESSDHLGDVAISTRHQPPMSGATKRRYHGPDHERDCLLGRPGRLINIPRVPWCPFSLSSPWTWGLFLRSCWCCLLK